MDLLSFTLLFILILLWSYMFWRLIIVLFKKDILKNDDIFYITSNPWEYKNRKEKEKNQKQNNREKE